MRWWLLYEGPAPPPEPPRIRALARCEKIGGPMIPTREEEAFLARLRADPSDDEARLVYADWLSEREGERAADQVAFLRAQVEGTLAELGELSLDPGWLAHVDKTAIEICGHSPLMQLHCPG